MLKRQRIIGRGICRGLFLDSPLQRRDWSCLPSSVIDSLFEPGDGALHHLSMWHFKVVLFGGRLRTQSPQLHQISPYRRHPLHPSASQQWVLLAMDGPGNCPLCQQHTGFPPAIRHLLCPQGCKLTMRCFALAGQRFQGRAQKGCLWWRMGGNFNPGAEAEH